MNILVRFDEAFRDAGDAPALICPDREDWTYARLLAEVDRATTALVARDIVAGDRVLVQVDKTPEAVALYLACLKAGAVYVPINTAYTRREVAYFIADCRPALFVAGGGGFEADVPVAVLDGHGGGSLWTGTGAASVPSACVLIPVAARFTKPLFPVMEWVAAERTCSCTSRKELLPASGEPAPDCALTASTTAL